MLDMSAMDEIDDELDDDDDDDDERYSDVAEEADDSSEGIEEIDGIDDDDTEARGRAEGLGPGRMKGSGWVGAAACCESCWPTLLPRARAPVDDVTAELPLPRAIPVSNGGSSSVVVMPLLLTPEALDPIDTVEAAMCACSELEIADPSTPKIGGGAMEC